MAMFCGIVLAIASASHGPVGQIEADRARIQHHLASVEAELRAGATDHLTAAQKAERLRNLDRLHEYWVAGEFPHNTDFAGQRVPYFIDDDGRACAVGHLVIESGAADLAARIRATENNALLGDMRTDGLLDWVNASGLSAAECAKIQPAYCECPDDEAPVCGSDGMTYLNQCYATTCAGVEVAHEGACAGEPTTGFPPPGTGGDDEGGSSTTGTTGDDGEDDVEDAEGGGGDADPGDDKGCSVGDRPDSSRWLALALLGLAGARVRRRR